MDVLAKAIGLIFRNPGAALRASVIPFAAMILVSAALFGPELMTTARPGDAAEIGGSEGGLFLRALLVLLVFFVGWCWLAVAWHRYVLLEEEPASIPRPPAGAVGAYGWSLVRLFGAVLIVVVVAGIAAGILSAMLVALGVPMAVLEFFGLGLSILFTYAILRFSLALPAAAIGQPMGVFESWGISAPVREVFLLTAALLVVLQYALDLAMGTLGLAGYVGLALAAIANWLVS